MGKKPSPRKRGEWEGGTWWHVAGKQGSREAGGGEWQVPPSPSPGALRPRPRHLGDMIEWHWLNVEEWHGMACHSFVSPAPFMHHHPPPALQLRRAGRLPSAPPPFIPPLAGGVGGGNAQNMTAWSMNMGTRLFPPPSPPAGGRGDFIFAPAARALCASSPPPIPLRQGFGGQGVV